MRYELAEYEWIAIAPMLPNKPRVWGRIIDALAAAHDLPCR